MQQPGGTVKHIEGTFMSVRNLNIYYQGWLPENEVKAVLLLVHGAGEHAGRYNNVVNHFVPLGYAIYGLDHIGHGKSDGEREVIERFEDYTEPLKTFYKMIAGWQPGKPVFIYGHSLGGLVTSFLLLDHQEDYKGAILSAAPTKVPERISPFTVALGKFLSSVAPKAGLLPLEPSHVSRDSSVVEAYINDPLVFHGKMPARLSAEMLRAMIRVSGEAKKISLPMLIIQGSEDKLIDPGGSRMLYEQSSSTDKTIKFYEGFYHEVHNDPGCEVMFKELEEWLQSKLG